MNQAEIILKWKKYFENNKLILKELIKYENINLLETNFLNPCPVINQSICAPIGVGLNKINTLTIRNFLATLIKHFNDWEDRDLIFIGSDGTPKAQQLIKDLALLKLEKGTFVTFENFDGFDKKFVSETIKKIKAKCGFFIQSSIYSPDLINVFFLDELGESYDAAFVKKINQEALNNNYFELELNEKIDIFYIENEKMIKIFVDKIEQLYTKRLNTKKTKIAISNHNQSVTKVLAKLLGHLDYAYVINDNVKPKNLFNSKMIDDREVELVYQKEIKFAQKTKSNILISFSPNGTQLMIFLVKRNSVTYLNKNLITLLFLHNFFNNLFLANKKLAKTWIASDYQPIPSIINLIYKYNLDFNPIKEVIYDPQNYLLYYWNNYNQFIFGEKRNVDFGIYNLFIKLLEILNFGILQSGGIQYLITNINMMYGHYQQIDAINDISLINLKNKIEKILSVPQSWSTYFIRDIKVNDHIKQMDEELLWTITFKNNDKFLIKYNHLINKAIITYYFEYSPKKLFSNYKYLNEFKKLLKKILD